MFGLSVWEVVIVLVVALLVLGPERLPDVARQLGRGMRELRRASNDLKSSINDAVIEAEREVRLTSSVPTAGTLPAQTAPQPHQENIDGSTRKTS